MVKMMLSLPRAVNADNFVEVATAVVLGRYGKDGYYNGLAAPKVEWLRMGNKDFTIYEIDGEEIDPAFISAVQTLQEFIPLKFQFRAGNKILADDWWRPSSKYFEPKNCRLYSYESSAAEDAAEEWHDKLAEYGQKKSPFNVGRNG